MTSSGKRTKEAKKKSHSRQTIVGGRSGHIAKNIQNSHPVLQLQRQVGNTAVTQEVKSRQEDLPKLNSVSPNQRLIQREEKVGLYETILRAGWQPPYHEINLPAETIYGTPSEVPNSPKETTTGWLPQVMNSAEEIITDSPRAATTPAERKAAGTSYRTINLPGETIYGSPPEVTNLPKEIATGSLPQQALSSVWDSLPNLF